MGLKFAFLLLSMIMSLGCSFPSLERSIFEYLSLFQFIDNRQTYSLSFEVTGLIGSGLEVQNGSESINIPANGSYEFRTGLSRGADYNVVVATQPTDPPQECQVFGGTGRVQSANVTTVQVVCGDELVVVSGTVTGLVGSGLELTNTTNSGTFAISIGSTSFAFPPQAKDSTYNLSVTNQPTNPWQTCSITNPVVLTGTIPDTGLVIEVTCTTDQYPLTVQVIGIGVVGTLTAGYELEITELNSAQVLQFTGDTSASFATNIASGSAYNLQIVNAGGIIATGVCTILSPTGIIQGASNVVVVNCSDGALVQGTVTVPGGSASSILGTGLELTILSVGGTPFTSQSFNLTPGQTNFTFPGTYPINAEFQVSITDLPSSVIQDCEISGTGTLATATITGNVTDLVVNCGLPEPSAITPAGDFFDTFSVSFVPPDVTGAEFRYTLGDGTAGQPDPDCTTPDTSTGLVPITSANAPWIKIRQCRADWIASAVVMLGAYNLRVADPTPSVASGTSLNSGNTVNFTTTTGGTWFCHTTDVSPTIPADPVCGVVANVCSVGTHLGFAMPAGDNRELKVRACRENFTESNVVSLNYPIATYQISGTIANLETPFGAGTFVLQNNGGNNLNIAANGSFTFATPIASGLNYNVTVLSQPQNPWQTCAVTNAIGTVATTNITNVEINCAVNTYNIAGTVTGLLPGNSITVSPGSDPFFTGAITINSGDSINILNVPSGTPIQFNITAQPEGQYCVFVNQTLTTGQVAGSDITTMDIECQEGYLVGNQFQSVPANRLDIHLYQGSVNDGPGALVPGADDGGIGDSRFYNPRGVTSVRDNLYMVDSSNHSIRRIDLGTAETFTFAGELTTSGDLDAVGNGARFASPFGITTDGTYLYVTDMGNHKIKKIRISSANVFSIAGDGTPGFADGVEELANFNTPQGIAIHSHYLYISDTGNRRIRRLDLNTNEVITIAGDGTAGGNDGVGVAARFDNPVDLVYLDGFLYITDSNGHTIRRLDPTNNSVTTIAGQYGFPGHKDQEGTAARLWFPHGLMTDGFDLYFTEVNDPSSRRIRRLDLRTNLVTTIAGQEFLSTNASAVGVRARFDTPSSLTTDGGQIFITDSHRGRSLRNNGLIFHYPLDRNIFAYGDKGNDLTRIGAPLPDFIAMDRFGEAFRSIEFNGTSQYLSGTDDDLPQGTSPRSLCAWAKSITLPPFGEARVIASYGGTANGEGFSIGVRGENGSSSVFVSGVNDTVLSYLTLDPNRWFHVCGLYDGSNVSIYVNGKFMKKEAKPWTTTLGGGTAFQVGARNGVNLFRGPVADVRVYGRLLSEGEISDLAKHANPTEVGASYSTLPSGLVLHYKLDGPIASEKFENSALPFYHIIDPIGTITNVRGKDLLPNGGLETREGGVQLPGVNDDLHALPFWDASRTVCSWVKPEVLPKNSGDIFPIFEYGTYVGNRLFSLVMAKVGTEDHVGLNVQDTLHTRSITLPLHTWTHLCASFDTSADVRIYVNGSQIGAPISAPSILTSSTGHIRLGYTENPALNYFPGRIDDVRLYNNALTPFQIRSLATPINEGVIARYDFRSDTQDMSGFGNDLGGLNIDSIANRWKEPVSAYRFNGTSSRISNTSEISKVTDQISFGAWIRPLVVSGTNSLLFYNGNSASNGFGLYLINTTNQLFYLDGGVGGSLSGVNIPIHVWTHVGFIKNGLNIKIFVNGRQVFDDTNAATIEPNGPVSIGSSPSNIEHFNGDISDVILFNRAIAPEEMVALSGYHPWQSTAWDPNPVSSSMIGHYQAESFDSLANNDPITAWLDNSGRNHNLTTVSANPPTYVTGTFPHRSSVRFLDTAEQWVQMDTGFPLDATNFTFFSAHVFDPAIPTTGDRYILNYGNDFNPLQISSNYDDPNFRTVLCRSNDKCADVPPPDAFSKSYPAGTPFFVRYNKLVSNIQVFSNGNLDTNITLTGGFLTNSLLRLGARYNNLATSFFRGNIGEILIFNNQLNTSTNIFGLTDRDYIDCYLSAKYGIRLDPTSTISCP